MSREPNFVNYADAMQETAHEQAQRIEVLEFEVEHERYNVEKTAQEAAKRIKVLEAALKEAGEMWVRKDNRIEQLETALLEIDRALIARRHIDQSSPPKVLLPCPVCGGEAIHAIDTLKRTVIQSPPKAST
jgi:DNA repair exonuclease SbcCD ATPase subunit